MFIDKNSKWTPRRKKQRTYSDKQVLNSENADVPISLFTELEPIEGNHEKKDCIMESLSRGPKVFTR